MNINNVIILKLKTTNTMKTKLLIIIGIVLLNVSNIKAQITLEHQYYIHHKNFYPIDLGNNDYKWVIVDSLGFSLYNLDHSPYLLNVVPPITLVQPSGFQYEVAYISKSLFDCDSTNIEYALTIGSAGSNFYVYRTDGTLVFEKDSVTGPYNFGGFDGSIIIQPIVNTPNGTKLMLQENDSHGPDNVYVYSLCGTLPTKVFDFSQQKSFVKIYPNPTSQLLNFEITIPDNYNKYELVILNSNGQELKREKTESKSSHLSIDVQNYSSGIYYYSLVAKDKVLQSGKFVITK
jgi:hypothetical protein